MWFDPKVTVNRLAEVSMLLHLTFIFIFLVSSVKILAGQVQIWATGYLLSPARKGNKNTDAGTFPDPLAQHQNIVPRGEQYAHWGSKWDGRTYGASFRLSSWTCQLWFQLCPSFLSSVSFTPSLGKPLTLVVCSHSTGLLSCSLKPLQDKWTDILDATLWPWQKGQIQ